MENFLTRLELQGFKSFASKTDFDFSDRIVGVVGPNGSGKSNIIDAIRWVLGEREAKNLRGDLLENLVFAGTSGRGPAGLARVTLSFDNRSGILPVENREVSVSRRIDRSGVSQFYINNQEVRLKDLVSALAKAKIGSRGFTIIGQGEADIFVRVSPRERREMIEEILGLKEHRLKKKTAERQLTRAEANMAQLEAGLAEIKPHLKFLRRQKNKWDKRSEIEEKLKILSHKYFGHYYHKFSGSTDGVEGEIMKLEKERKAMSEKVKILKEKVSEGSGSKEKEIKETREELEKLRRRRLELEKKMARAEARVEYGEEPEEKSKERSSSFLLSDIKLFIDEAGPALGSGSRGKVRDVLEKWVKYFRSFFAEEAKEEMSSGFNEELEKIKKEIKEIDEAIKDKEREENDILEMREKKSRKLRGQIDELEREKDKERDIEDKIKEKEMIRERAEFRLRELKNKWCGLGFPEEDLEKLERPSSQDDWDEMEGKIERLNSKLSVIGEIDEALIEEARETEDRYASTTKELEDLKKASADLKTLIDDLEKKIHDTFKESFNLINKEFNNYFRLMFGGGRARLKLVYPERTKIEEGEDKEKESSFAEASEDKEENLQAGVEISLNLPKKKMSGLDMLSGGEKSLVSIAALFALVFISPPPFLVLDEVDAALDDENARRFSELVKEFSEKTQFLIVTHNKIMMEVIDTLYGITMGDDGVSKVLSLRLQD